MGRLLENESGDGAGGAEPAVPFSVGGTAYRNAAAKFWTALVCEVESRFGAGCTAELAAPQSGVLTARQLFPNIVTDEDFEGLEDVDLRAQIERTLAELEVYGPPAAVAVTVWQRGSAVWQGAFPDDTLDSETFPFMVVWLLEWARLERGTWNDPLVEGAFTGQDRGGREYRVAFRLRREPVSEGLFQLSVRLQAGVGPCAAPPGGATRAVWPA